jgi:hypothetical protein
MQVPEARARCNGLLYARGLDLVAGGHHDAAHSLLASALFYSPPGAAHARGARLLAACCAARGQCGAALEYLSQAVRHDVPAGKWAPAEGRLLELRVLCMLLAQEQQQASGTGKRQQPGIECPDQDLGVAVEGREDGGEEEQPAECVWRRVCKAAAELPATKLRDNPGAAGEHLDTIMQVRAMWRGLLKTGGPRVSHMPSTHARLAPRTPSHDALVVRIPCKQPVS